MQIYIVYYVFYFNEEASSLRALQTGTMQLLHYYYWHQKQKFQHREDIYPYWIAFAVEEGSFRYALGANDADEATRGDWVICPPETVFQRDVLRPLSFHFLGFRWTELPANLPNGKITLADEDRLSSAYRSLHRLYALPPEQAMSWRTQLLQEVWNGYVLQQLLPSQRYPDDGDPLMLTARRKLKAHAFRTLSLKAIADELNISPVQFTRRFKAAFGCTATEYVRQLRLDHGKQLLMETNLTVDQIAQECGYENGFYFSRVFTRHSTMSPSEYRRTHRL